MVRTLDSHMLKKKKKETGPLSFTIHKNQIKMMKDLNGKPEAIELLEESIGDKLLNISLGNDFLDMT